MNSQQIAIGQLAARMRDHTCAAYHQRVDLGVIAVRRADDGVCMAEAGG
jgi:hypothetical protein